MLNNFKTEGVKENRMLNQFNFNFPRTLVMISNIEKKVRILTNAQNLFTNVLFGWVKITNEQDEVNFFKNRNVVFGECVSFRKSGLSQIVGLILINIRLACQFKRWLINIGEKNIDETIIFNDSKKENSSFLSIPNFP